MGSQKDSEGAQKSSEDPSVEGSGPYQHFIGSYDESLAFHECMDEEATRIRAAAQLVIPSLRKINYFGGWSRQNRSSMEIALGNSHSREKKWISPGIRPVP